MPKRWRVFPHHADKIASLSRTAGIPAILAQLLVCRGLHDALVARRFLEPRLSDLRPPEELPGLTAAVEQIAGAISSGRKITVYGDYDVDGVTGTSILVGCLKLLGSDAGYYLPHRVDEGYGLHDDSLSQLASGGTQLLITVDCGISAIGPVATARRLGMDLVITDHHELASSLPEANAIVHPRLPGTAYPFGGLSGAGVALKLAWGLCQNASQAKRVSGRMKQFLLSAVGLAALGTVGDVVPLVDENRSLVTHGLASLKEHASPGLTALFRVSELADKRSLEAEDIAFKIGPRLNAAGRLGQARLAVELLTTTRDERAGTLADYLNQLNSSRQSLERSIQMAANKQAQAVHDLENDPVLVLAERGWHPGVIGIVAGKLAEKYHRPVVLIALDAAGARPGIGSARSVPGFNLHEALSHCGGLLSSHGGHAAAAGLKIDEKNVEAFRGELCDHAASTIAASHRAAELRIDAEVPLAALSFETVQQLDRMAPFGEGNPRPLLCASDVKLAAPPRRIGENGNTLDLRLAQHTVAMRGVAFGGGDWIDELSAATSPLSFAFRPVINEYRGRRSVELRIVDWQAGTSADGGERQYPPAVAAPAS